MQKIFGMISLGCDKNRVDGERLLGEVKRHGCEITDDISRAQVLIINTCAFLNAAREESINAVLESNAYRNGALEKIVVTGCLPEKFIGELFPALTEGDVFLGVNDASELFPALERSYREGRINAVGTGNGCMPKRVVSTVPHLKYLKIADGCFRHCTYCLIPKIRGKYRSYSLEDLIAEAESLGDTQELVLVAQDTTRYGEDSGENQFCALLRKLSALENIHQIRILYCYPEAITEELVAEVRDNPKIVKYLDIPFQHSETRILKLMGRMGTRESYLNLLEKLRREIKGIAVRSTFMAGFPSETEEDHAGLCAFLKEAKLENCGFFAYSREPDTPAYRMKGQVPAQVKKRRVRELYAVQKNISLENLKKYVGETLTVLCDGIDYENSCFLGRAYFQAYEIDGVVRFTAPRAQTGEYYSVYIDKTDGYDLFGRVEEPSL